jgi:hypothetical protein
MNKYLNLLKEATEKLIELNKTQAFENELLTKAPPVLWFGDNSVTKDKIVTIGANPSREEFLSENKFKANERLINGKSLQYLKNPSNRFKLLGSEHDWSSILKDKPLQEEIIISYNEYFRKNPYKWFGKKERGNELSYNVEGFINGLDASYYDGNRKYQCLHIDLMPFPTISDFTSILKESEEHVFKNDWSKKFLDKLIKVIKPKKIVVFGRTNVEYFQRFLGLEDIGKPHTFSSLKENGLKSSAVYWLFKYKDIDVIGLSVNLGNPKGFNKKTLREFGSEVNQKNNAT